MKDVKFNIETKTVETYKANCYRAQISMDSIVLEFGQSINKEEVKIVSSISITPNVLKEYVARLVAAGMAYEKKYKKNIGFREKIVRKGEE